MILPIVAYGQAILKKRAEDVEKSFMGLTELLNSMWETMYNAQGVGLAAPQIGLSKRIFIIDTEQALEEEKKEEGIKQSFINPIKLSEDGEVWTYEEGCLSIPNIRGDVDRQEKVRLRYQNENCEIKEETFDGINARIIQHEYDHLEGILFVDKIKPLKKKLLKRKLENIKKGSISVDYNMKFKS